ncbi:MAG: hypothetical protein AB7G06_03980, partial [Bdellovibrionales bacterium]
LYGPVWLYVQQRPDEQSGSKPEGAASGGVRQTRFLIDLELSRLGHTQLEGIAKHNHIDLKLNTPSALPQDLQRELVTTYTNAASAYGFTGELLFTSGPMIDFRQRGGMAKTI